MHVIILGAGRIGQYVAQSLSLDGHSVVLVDIQKIRLEEVSQKMDIAIKRGKGTDWQLLSDLMQENPDLVLALTDNDEVNLTSCAIAKALGQVRTIARIKNSQYLQCNQFDVRRLFHVDHLVLPELLVTEQIAKISLNKGLYSESFFHGGVLLRTLIVPENWPHSGKHLSQLQTSQKKLIAALIRRRDEHGNDEILFPHGQDKIYAGDEVSFIGDTSLVQSLESFFHIDLQTPKSMLILGGQLIGNELADNLSKRGISTRLVESSASRCYKYAEELKGVSVIHCQNPDYDFLKAERVESMDIVVAATQSDEKNLHIALLSQELGCKKVIAVIADPHTARLAEKLGILHVVSPRIATTDRILTLAREEKVTSVVSFYDQRAEITEVKVSLDSPIAGIPLSVLGPKLPDKMLIAVIHNRGRLFIAGGTHILSPQDKVIVVCAPEHRKYLEQIF